MLFELVLIDDPHQMPDLGDHAPDRAGVGDLGGTADAVET
jgi:hypothetical protein